MRGREKRRGVPSLLEGGSKKKDLSVLLVCPARLASRREYVCVPGLLGERSLLSPASARTPGRRLSEDLLSVSLVRWLENQRGEWFSGLKKSFPFSS